MMNPSIFFGAAYYPELWPDGVIEQDIRLMKEAGINLVRIGEFAWSKMEPEMDAFDFGWLHEIVDRLARHRISVILGTPTATPPVWLTQAHPGALRVDSGGYPAQHGARRHCCSNNAAFRERAAILAKRLAREFAADGNVVGWQLDNELAPENRGCFCPSCVSRFHDWLENKFKTIDALNRRWNLGLWSMSYQSFGQIPPPNERTWHHPSLITEWLLFQSDSNAKFLAMQADILRKNGVTAPIGTDMMPVLAQDYAATTKELDVIQFNHYINENDLYLLPFWFSYLRTLKGKPFWVTETSACWGGATVPAGYREKGFCRVNTWMGYAMGADVCMYWLWRSHIGGQELMHGSVLTSAGRPMHLFDEVRQIAGELGKAGEILAGTKVKRAELAIHLSHYSDAVFQGQQLIPELEGKYSYQKLVSQLIYKPLLECRLAPDVIDTSVGPDGYRVIISAFVPCLERDDLISRMVAWVKKGGIWVVGPLTDLRNIDGAKYPDAPYGFMEELAGVFCKYQIPAFPKTFGAKFNNGQEFNCGVCCDGFEVSEDTQSLAQYADYPLEGLSAVTYRKIGDGGIMLLGTMPDHKSYISLIKSICLKANIQPVGNATQNLLMVPRQGDGEEYLICIEYQNKPAVYKNSKKLVNLLDGKTYNGNIKIMPYEVLVLKELGKDIES